MLSKKHMKQVEKAWTNIPKRLPRTRWWESSTIKQFIAQKVCGRVIHDGNWGRAKLLELNKVFDRAISIGGGTGHKEIVLLESGIVNHFDVYELSADFIQQGEALAKERNLSDKITFHYGDFFTSAHNKAQHFDLVFWSGSLHHMFNTKFAILISHNILKDDGYFYCDEFVGKNRFQYSKEEMDIINEVRAGLDADLFNIPNTDKKWNVFRKKPDLQQMIEADISEAADSENIIPSISAVFPHAKVIPLGGLIYSQALSDILTNIPENSQLLQTLLELDHKLALNNFNLYAFTLCSKHVS